MDKLAQNPRVYHIYTPLFLILCMFYNTGYKS
jgi:hypothetical protein